jgi:catechol 2,3-dioxygenase-like lactoylglutathione lyase family enzyme
MSGPPRVPTRQVLHLNLNTMDLDAAHAFYRDLLGMDLRMQSSGDDGDWRFHGIEEPVDSAGWFLYDDRGPRTSPALELVLWRRPATAGSAYGKIVHRGLTAVGFEVDSLDGLAERALSAGGSVVGDLGADGLLVRDPDGVHVELRVRPVAQGVPPRLATARIGCADLVDALRWYAGLGFATTAGPTEGELVVDGESLRLRSATVALASGSVELLLTQWLEPPAVDPAEGRLWHRGMVRMAVSVDDLDESIAVLEAAGRPCPDPQYFTLPGTSIGGLRVLFLTDPDGFTVELVHRPPRHFDRTQPVVAEVTG